MPGLVTLDFAPFLSWAVLGTLAAIAAALIAYGVVRRARGLGWRTLAILALLAALANPVLVEEERRPIDDVAAIVVDNSPSQNVRDRTRQSEDALAKLRERLAAMPGLEVRVVRAGAPSTGAGGLPTDGTRLFDALSHALADVPRKRMAATILITDGQVHDVPAADKTLPFAGPLHVLLSGAPGERDRRLTVVNAPRFGLVGKEVEIRLKIEDPGADGQPVRMTLSRDGGPAEPLAGIVGRETTTRILLDHAGPNIFEFGVEGAPDELTQSNNRTVVTVNGVRERLRVLLVSGEPHPGERVWRNFLKADPSVDLVHFTILRPPEKQDATPVRELSLIAFPIRELFEVKLDEFDLIIFDRYRRRGVLPSLYLQNIARYVDRGGAVLEAAGPAFATSLSLYQSPLGPSLPGEPTGRVFDGRLKAHLSSSGKRHPITADLPGADDPDRHWGRWFRQIDANATRGTVLMDGVQERPLLIVDRVGKGRVAQLLSDHIWLWAREYDGGGPHSELLRRLAHWLMKEPDLEEDRLEAHNEGNRLVIVRRSVEPDESPVEVTSPSGETQTVTLAEGIGGRARATVPVTETGLYRVSDRRNRTLAAVGTLNPLEYADMRATPQPLAALVEATGGGISWLGDGVPEARRVHEGRRTAGRNWIGVVENREYSVTGVREVPLLPGLALLLLGLGALMLAWRREGR
jgi:hypothetical protein